MGEFYTVRLEPTPDVVESVGVDVADMAVPKEPPQEIQPPAGPPKDPVDKTPAVITGVGRFLKRCWNDLELSKKRTGAIEKLVALSNDETLPATSRQAVLFELGKYHYERGDLEAAKVYFTRYSDGEKEDINQATPYILAIKSSSLRETSGREIMKHILACRDFFESALFLNDKNVIFTKDDFRSFAAELVDTLSKNGGGLSTFPLFGDERMIRRTRLVDAVFDFVNSNRRPCFKALVSQLVSAANTVDMEIIIKRMASGNDAPVQLQFVEFALMRPATGDELKGKLKLLSICALSDRDVVGSLRRAAMEKLEEELGWLTKGDMRNDPSLASFYRDLAKAYSNDGNERKARLFSTLAEKKSRLS